MKSVRRAMPAAGLEPAKPPIGLAGGLVSGVGVHLLQLLAGLDQRQGLAAVGDGAVIKPAAVGVDGLQLLEDPEPGLLSGAALRWQGPVLPPGRPDGEQVAVEGGAADAALSVGLGGRGEGGGLLPAAQQLQEPSPAGAANQRVWAVFMAVVSR